MLVLTDKNGPVTTIIINRPEVRNAVDGKTARELADAFRAFENDPDARVAVLTGAGGFFCAGADLKGFGEGRGNRVVKKGNVRKEAEKLAAQIADFPWNCVLSDRRSAYEGASLPFDQAMEREFELGLATVESGETLKGAGRFAEGAGRHGEFE
jgi:enoyl-CoA hydratase/carnithine racemase